MSEKSFDDYKLTLPSTGYPNFSTSLRLTPLPPPQAPTFPTLAELASASDERSRTRPTGRAGLFESLLGSAAPILYDLLDHPDKYEPGVDRLVQQLTAGRPTTELDQDELELLDRAVLDFSRAPRTPAVRASVTAISNRRTADELTDSERQVVNEPDDHDGPPTRAFWWL
jgi:hypothetical protein